MLIAQITGIPLLFVRHWIFLFGFECLAGTFILTKQDFSNGLLDAQAFQERFMRWVEETFDIKRGQVIAVDGKTARGSRDSWRRFTW
jgi:hypothetical protein